MDSTQIVLQDLAERTAKRDGFDWSKMSDLARRDYLALARTMHNRIFSARA